MIWLWIGLGILAALLAAVTATLAWSHRNIVKAHLPAVVRIFTEKPLFIVPRGRPAEDAEDVTFTNADGQKLRGCYLRAATPERLGVVLFGLEFGSNRWACVPYCQFLRDAGYDVFSFEPRSQGDSDAQPGYEPLQWVTEYEVRDFEAALAYLKSRDDADPRGVGFFGLSKGGGAGLLAALDDDWVRCGVTDGAFATHVTMVPYMRKWVAIYSTKKRIYSLLPACYYGHIANLAIRQVERERHCRFPHLEVGLRRLRRPLLMIHGGADNYIKPEMAQALFESAGGPKEFWLVEGAKHNQAFHVANGEYQARILGFFREHLAREASPAAPAVNGHPSESRKPAPLGASE